MWLRLALFATCYRINGAVRFSISQIFFDPEIFSEPKIIFTSKNFLGDDFLSIGGVFMEYLTMLHGDENAHAGGGAVNVAVVALRFFFV